MKAVQITAHGGPEGIEYGDAPEPEVGRGEVHVDVKAGALNHLDIRTRQGLPGSDATGVVREVGADVTRFEPRIREALPTSETARAHELLKNREGFGNVVVVPDSEQ